MLKLPNASAKKKFTIEGDVAVGHSLPGATFGKPVFLIPATVALFIPLLILAAATLFISAGAKKLKI